MTTRLPQCYRLLVLPVQCRRHITTNTAKAIYNRSGTPGKVFAAGTILAAIASFPSIRRFFSNSNKVSQLKSSIGTATMHLHQGETEEAKKYLTQGLEMIKNEIDTKGAKIEDKELIFLVDQLGNIAVQCEEYQSAVMLYACTIEGFVHLGVPRSDRSITEYLLKIAQLYALLGDNRSAEIGFVHCITVTTNQLSNNTITKDTDTGTLAGLGYEGLGKLYLSLNDTENALNCYKHALDFAERYSGPMDSHMPILMSDIATVYETLGRYDDAIEMIYQAELHGQKSQPLYNQCIVFHRAKLLDKIGNIEEARSVYEEVKELCILRGDDKTLTEVKGRLARFEKKVEG